MPMPKPGSGESPDDFTKRCMSALAGEFDDQEQRYAICQSLLEGKEIFDPREVKFNPDQPRDDWGRWSDTGAGDNADADTGSRSGKRVRKVDIEAEIEKAGGLRPALINALLDKPENLDNVKAKLTKVFEDEGLPGHAFEVWPGEIKRSADDRGNFVAHTEHEGDGRVVFFGSRKMLAALHGDAEALMGTAAHEAFHVKHSRVLNSLNLDDFEDILPGFDMFALREAGGITKYSRDHWRHQIVERRGFRRNVAVNETGAELTKLRYLGKSTSGIAQIWKDYVADVDKSYATIAHRWKPIKKPEQARVITGRP